MKITILSGKCDPTEAIERVDKYLNTENIKPSKIILGGFRYLDFVASGIIIKRSLKHECIIDFSQLLKKTDLIIIIGSKTKHIKQYIEIIKKTSTNLILI
jgi:hypothetical protein